MKKIFLLFVTIGLISSCNYLDVIPAGKATEEDLFKTHIQADNFATSLYTYMPERYNIQFSPDFVAGGDLVTPLTSGPVSYWKWKSWIYNDLETPSNTYYAFWSQAAQSYPDGVEKAEIWKGIRNAYLMLQHAEGVPDASPEEVSRWKGESYWIIAYLHHTLLEFYGPIPLADHLIGLNEENNSSRETYLKCVDFIAGLYDKAADFLPANYPNMYWGRATKTCAKAFKARLLLTAASPLINGNTEWYSQLVNLDGTPLIPQTYDKELWKKAMVAADDAIKQGEADGFGIYAPSTLSDPFERGYENLREAFLGAPGSTKNYNSQEHLFSYLARSHYNTKNFAPRYQYPDKYTGGKIQYYRDGWRGSCVPTMEAVNVFLTKNGLPWNVDPATKNLDPHELTPAPFAPGEQTVQMHLNREPRFYAFVGYDRGEYDVDGQTIVLKCRRGETSQNDGEVGNEFQTATGYYLKKWVKKEDTFNYEANKWSLQSFAFPYMRMAEMYLSYAEAEAEYTGTLSATGLEYINKVRIRAGIPDFETSWNLAGGMPSGKVLVDAIRQERLSEFAFEGRWFHDLRRWKTVQDVLGHTPHGWNLAGQTAEEFYKVTEINEGSQTRTFTVPRNVWLAVPQDQININANLVQNPGY